MTAAFTADIGHFIAARGVELVRFAKGQRKDDLTREYLRRAELMTGGWCPAGAVCRGGAGKAAGIPHRRRRNPVTGATYPWLVAASGVVNQYYFYCVDEDFGPVCVKFSGYFPYTGRLIINGNEYAKRQAAKAGIGSCRWTTRSPPSMTWPRCRRSATAWTRARSRRWPPGGWRILPHPFTAEDTAAGYRYELSVLQAEFSLTQTLDSPVAGRISSTR